MHKETKRSRKGADEAVLIETGMQTEILQEIIINKNGDLEFPWITPKATSLILCLWEFNSGMSFPITVLSGNIYCG